VLVKRLPETSIACSMAVPNIRLQAIAAIAYTSGSTGKPKANSKTWAVLSGTAQLLGQRFLTGEQLLIPTVPPQHMYGLETSIFMTLQTSAALFAGKTFYPQDIAQAASDHANSILVTTPVHLRALDQALPALKGVGKVISATAALQQSLARAVEAKLDCSVEEIYGFTEAGSTASRRTLDGAKWQLLDSMQLIAEDNEIFVTGPQLSERVAVLDKISLLDNGSAFELAGRAEDVINVAGKRASLVDLNNKLLAVDGVEDAIIFMPDGEAEAKRPAALIVTERDKKAVLSDFAKKVEAVFIPRPVYLVPELKRQATGKIPRQQLLDTLARLRQIQRAAE
jgi:acyl-coenzyme A synthetase/AMP-(fatty) acid ligase